MSAMAEQIKPLLLALPKDTPIITSHCLVGLSRAPHHLALPGGPARPRLSSAYLAKRRTLTLTKLLALKVGLLAVACGFKRVINLVIDNHAQYAAPLHFVRPHYT